MPGISQAYAWEATHPLNGKKVYGYVGVFSVTAAIQANELRDVFDSLKGSRGGAGISNVRPDRSKSNGKAPGKGGGRTGGGSGAEGEDP